MIKKEDNPMSPASSRTLVKYLLYSCALPEIPHGGGDTRACYNAQAILLLVHV